MSQGPDIMNQTFQRAGLWAGLPTLAALGLLVLIGPVWASSLVDWDDLEPSELRTTYLKLERAVDLKVAATATVSREDERPVAYPWILDAETRKLVWQIDPERAKKAARPRKRQGTVLVKQEEKLRLEPGRYEVYFTTYGDVHKVSISPIPLPGLSSTITRLGKLSQDDWQLKITCEDEDRKAILSGTAARPRFNPLLRIADSRPSETHRRPFRLDAPVTLVVYAIGEYDIINHNMADQAWIERGSDQKRVWELSPKKSRLAGGGQKNRRFRGKVNLEAGTYVLGYSTDDSHSPDEWNVNPPRDPAFWGVALFDHEGARAHFATDVQDPISVNRLVDLDRQVDSTFEMRGIRVRKPITARVKAVGEHAGGGHFVDFGWVEEAITHDTVWRMTEANSEPAGGAPKNRVAEDIVLLPPGEYLVCYWTDDSHAYRSWNASPPREPEAWGIQVWGIGKDFDPASVETYEEDRDPRILAQLLGIGDDRHATERFEISERTRARLLGLGEGTHGQMFDYGWLQRVDGPAPDVIWRMRYSQTERAGGDVKNRREEKTLQLDPGTYELHYVTDDSHSFEDWNSEPPSQPHLWGVAVYRTD
jgi:hypothetical protein